MDYEVISQMQVDDWKKEISSSLNMFVNKVMKKKYPFIIDIADTEFIKTSIILKELKLKVTLYVDNYPSHKVHMDLNKDLETLLDMRGLGNLDTSDGEKWKLETITNLVLNN